MALSDRRRKITSSRPWLSQWLPVRRLWRRLLQAVQWSWTKAFALLGCIVVLVALWTEYQNTVPEIHALGPDYSSPFTLPFAVKNISHLFAMKDVEFDCGLYELRMQGGMIGHFVLTNQNDSGRTIEPGETLNYLCDFGVRPSDVIVAKVDLWATYSTLIFKRKSQMVRFEWAKFADPPRWIEGKTPN